MYNSENATNDALKNYWTNTPLELTLHHLYQDFKNDYKLISNIISYMILETCTEWFLKTWLKWLHGIKIYIKTKFYNWIKSASNLFQVQCISNSFVILRKIWFITIFKKRYIPLTSPFQESKQNVLTVFVNRN